MKTCTTFIRKLTFRTSANFHAFYSLKQPLNSVSFRPHTFSPHFQTRTSFCILPLALDQANDLYSKISIQKHDIKKKQKKNCLRHICIFTAAEAFSKKCESKHHSPDQHICRCGVSFKQIRLTIWKSQPVCECVKLKSNDYNEIVN